MRYYFYGLLEVQLKPHKSININYGGNMGSTIKDIRKCIQGIADKHPEIAELVEQCYHYGTFETDGVGQAYDAPSYMWSKTLQLDKV